MYDHKTGRYTNGEKTFETFNQAEPTNGNVKSVKGLFKIS
jgi:hypothetical protein